MPTSQHFWNTVSSNLLMHKLDVHVKEYWRSYTRTMNRIKILSELTGFTIIYRNNVKCYPFGKNLLYIHTLYEIQTSNLFGQEFKNFFEILTNLCKWNIKLSLFFVYFIIFEIFLITNFGKWSWLFNFRPFVSVFYIFF